jgi:hypothetical protein
MVATAALTASSFAGGRKHGCAARRFNPGYDGTPCLLVAIDNADLGTFGCE